MTCCSDLKKRAFPDADPKCFSNSTVASENRRKLTLELKSKGKNSVCKIKVDGCLIKDQETKKCDFVFVICPEERFLFVELKGTDINQAVNQILATIRYFQEKTKIVKDQIEGFIVASSVPKANQTWRNHISRFKAKTGKSLIIQSQEFTYPIK